MGADTIAEAALADAIDDPEVRRDPVPDRLRRRLGSRLRDASAAQVRRAVEAGKPVIVSMGDVRRLGRLLDRDGRRRRSSPSLAR